MNTRFETLVLTSMTHQSAQRTPIVIIIVMINSTGLVSSIVRLEFGGTSKATQNSAALRFHVPGN